MGKRKRNKKDAATLSQEEIWDDSALIQSWEDAVEEYKLYHSIQARGENVEDVLRQAEAGSSDAEAEVTDGAVAGAAAEDEVERSSVTQPAYAEESGGGDATREFQDGAAATTSARSVPQAAKAAPASEPDGTATAGPPNVPQAVLGGPNASGRDDGMKNLMMAWYFAGYYTGLYEGQQLANRQQ